MTIYLSLLVCLLGLVIWIIANARAQSSPPPPPVVPWARIGEHMFWVGLLAFLMRYVSSGSVSFLK